MEFIREKKKTSEYFENESRDSRKGAIYCDDELTQGGDMGANPFR